VSKKNVVNITNVKSVITRFDAALVLASGLDALEDPALMRRIFDGLSSPTPDEMNTLTDHFRRELGKYIKNVPARSHIERIVNDHLKVDQIWSGYTYIGEENGSLYVLDKKEKRSISNFTLKAKHAIMVQGKGGEKIHLFEIRVAGSNKVQDILLTSSDFNTIKELQRQLKLQAGNLSPRINGCANYMNDLGYKFIDLPDWGEEKQGTSLLGLEVLEDGKKYFCAPNLIYDLDGKESKDIVAMGNNEANKDEMKNWTNLEYDEKKWANIAKTFLENILHINRKEEMEILLGWAGAIPHDYVVRKESKLNYFPHCQIVGVPGAGKSTIMTLLKQYMGHNDSSPRAFPSPFELSKLLNSSYTIPVVLDEYGKRWKQEMLDSMNRILVECFTRPYYSKGTSTLESVYYKHKNPLMYGGQVGTSEKALMERVVQVTIEKAFQLSAQGAEARKKLDVLQNQKDKNFWVGYNLWCARHTNEEVLLVFNRYRKHSISYISDERIANIYAVVMLGLHYMKKLAVELEVDMNVTDEDILSVPERVSGSSKIEDIEEANPLKEFLSDVAQLGVTRGNTSYLGTHFGTGKTVAKMMITKPEYESGVYGEKKLPACIYGNDLLLVKIKEMVTTLNKENRNNKYSAEEIMTFIDGEFAMSKANAPDIEKRRTSLVLAPKSYKTRDGNYTAFNWAEIVNRYPEYNGIIWQDVPKK